MRTIPTVAALPHGGVATPVVPPTIAEPPAAAHARSMGASDRDVIEDHRLRRERLVQAVGRGCAHPGVTATWRHTVAGLVLTVVALGGTVCVEAVQEALTATRHPGTASNSSLPGSPAFPDAAASTEAGTAAPGRVTLATGRPYGPQNRDATTR